MCVVILRVVDCRVVLIFLWVVILRVVDCRVFFFFLVVKYYLDKLLENPFMETLFFSLVGFG